jgi:hypothetical protein
LKKLGGSNFLKGSSPEFGQAEPALKQLNLNKLSAGSPKTHRLWGASGLKAVAARRCQKPILQIIYIPEKGDGERLSRIRVRFFESASGVFEEVIKTF